MKLALDQMPLGKSLAPDVTKVILDVINNGRDFSCINSTDIALIPMKKSASSSVDFCLISFV